MLRLGYIVRVKYLLSRNKAERKERRRGAGGRERERRTEIDRDTDKVTDRDRERNKCSRTGPVGRNLLLIQASIVNFSSNMTWNHK